MKVIGTVSLVGGSILAAGLISWGLAQPQTQRFAAETRTFGDITRTLNGTWKLKQRSNPDGSPYKSRLEGVTYISIRGRTGDNLGPHAVATLYAKESGVADTNFFKYPAEVAGKPFTMESSGTWLIHNVQNTPEGAQISARVFTMAKGDLQPYKNGMILGADIRYNVARTSPRAGLAAVPRMAFTTINSSNITDLTGRAIGPSSAFLDACCGMTSLVVTGDTMEIGWSNKGKDVWVRSDPNVPGSFR
jgi:hypothetical protein